MRRFYKLKSIRESKLYREVGTFDAARSLSQVRF
jgi:hypothetical protein